MSYGAVAVRPILSWSDLPRLLTGRHAPYRTQTCLACSREYRAPASSIAPAPTSSTTHATHPQTNTPAPGAGLCPMCTIRTSWLLTIRLGAQARMGFALLPENAVHDRTIPLRWRVYIELQRRGAAADYTPIDAADLAALFERSRATIYRVLQQLLAQKYVERQHYSGAHGGRCWRYRITTTTGDAPRGSVA